MSEGVASGRARRRTAKKVDYSKEQEFSDEGVFEDSGDEAPPQQAPKRRGGGGNRRKRAAPAATNSMMAAQNHPSLMGMEEEEEFVASKPVYTERGYDPSLPPLRERFPFLPEYEEDGSPKIDLIVGRRPVDDNEEAGEDRENEEETPPPAATRRRSTSKKKGSPKKGEKPLTGPVEYEYLIKYKGRSYLHLEWKTGADLESMNKSAKGIYRRYLKKVAAGIDEDIENPEFDPSYVVPEKICDEAEQEIAVELSDKELLRWEKQREKELAEGDEDTPSKAKARNSLVSLQGNDGAGEDEEEKKESEEDDWDATEEMDYINISMDKLRRIVNRDGPYYKTIKGSTNPYRDGYITEPPRKPRASYLLYQCAMRSYYAERHKSAVQSDLMVILGNAWQAMSDAEKAPFLQLAKEEMAQYNRELAMLEKAQKPNEVWQPIRRCAQVLERLAADSFAEIFLEPVNTDDFPDYLDVIDTPMDLGTVRKGLKSKKYQAAEQFARDMRKIWNNCKIFNQHGSAIWHVADYMSKQFERLYQAWVLDFRERYLRWADPRARPWEHSCRKTDGKCRTPDDQMVVCDHCDALYGFKCLDPPLKKAPKKAWHCPECRPRLKSAKGARMLSAVAENAARKRAELGDLPKKKVKQMMYLVKWQGLGYEFCTWETREDVNDSAAIARFHRLNNTFPEEADMSAENLEKVLSETKHVTIENAGGNSTVPSFRAQLYAQTRALEFAKFGMTLPDPVLSSAGPTSSTHRVLNELKQHPREVVDCLQDMLFKVERQVPSNPIRSNTSLPPPMTGEYDAIIPITSKGLMMNVGEIHGSVSFLGYRTFPDGTKGPAELLNLIRNVGDKIIAVDGNRTIGLSFREVIEMLRESGKNKFAYMRFLENRFAVCESELASVGSVGRYAIVELRRKFTADRQRMVVQRTQQLIEEEGQEKVVEADEDFKSKEEEGDEEESEDEGSEGEFQPDSDDEEIAEEGGAAEDDDEATSTSEKAATDPLGMGQQQPLPLNGIMPDGQLLPGDAGGQTQTTTLQRSLSASMGEDAVATNVQPDQSNQATQGDVPPEDDEVKNGILNREETTRSLAYRLLDVDIGFSSDEGGDEDCAYYMDGVDSTFCNSNDLKEETTAEDDAAADSGKAQTKKKAKAAVATVPARQNEFSALGDRAKLAAAVALSTQPPAPDDFDRFPYPSSKEVAAAEKKAAEGAEASPQKQKRSTVKIEQVSVSTGELVHVWANVEAAAATLQLPIDDLRKLIRGEYDEDLGDELGGYKWRYALAGAKVTAGNASSRSGGGGGKKAKEAWLEFRDKLYDPAVPHKYKNGNRLRDYQVDGVNWLASTFYRRSGCVLADEMGLGKTVQIVCYIEHLFRVEKIRRPFLVVVPLSTIGHWQREFEAWTDMICCVYHDRQRIWRDVLREYEWYYPDRPHTPDFLKFDVLVTTYDTLIGDFDVVSQVPFRVTVVDEAHRLRNQKGKLLECMKELSGRGNMTYGFQSRVLMTGTPLQNDLTELWTLLNFIEPSQFPDLGEFRASYGNMQNREQVESLQQMISPFMLRRCKEDVAKDIPAKEETVIDVELTSIQKQYYRAIFEHNHAFLSMGSTRQTAPKLMNIQMELRKVCNHPFLLEGIEHRETDRMYRELSESGKFDGKTPEEQQQMLNEHGYIMMSGKMVLLDKLLPKLRREGHKILIFSQMVKMLDLISEYFEFRDFRYERLDGRVRGTDRQKAIDRFEREADSFAFLLSTRAGGVGINLTAADICIIFDSDWNPQNDVQAQARCHRIGQTKDVRIYRLVTSRSFEQEMFDRASKKLGLEQAVLGTFEKDKEDDKPSQQEMEQLLKRGAYALLEDENDRITEEFCADDIESILAKRTRTRVVEGAKTASWLNKQGMVVSKSKFSAEEGNQVDMDDPNFWQKVMPDFVTPAILLKKLEDLQHEIDGTKKGPGRGRWRQKREEEAARKAKADKEANGDDADDDSDNEEKKQDEDDEDEDDSDDEGKVKLSRGNIRKVGKFIGDLKSMMASVLDDAEDGSLPSEEKTACQQLLLTITVKEKIFNEEQRHLARKYLKRLEGDRKRRCRTSEQPRFKPGHTEETPATPVIPQLAIVGKKRVKRRRGGGGGGRGPAEDDSVDGGEPAAKRQKKEPPLVGEDGYLRHSDSEGDWSDVGDNIYGGGQKRESISKKESHRRRAWGADDDAATAAGRPWPVFPRHVVKDVLSTLLDEVLKLDEEQGGVFSVPVSRDDFPEYYEQIKHPMDYGTMKQKLENGEYRSAQAMQKDFILVVQNCRQFNAATSDIVKEAREQHLKRPRMLRDAALAHNLFLAEDGAVIEISGDGSPKKKKKKPLPKNGEEDEDAVEAVPVDENDDDEPKKKKKSKRGDDATDETGKGKKSKGKKDKSDDADSKPRIKIKLKAEEEEEKEKAKKSSKKGKKKGPEEVSSKNSKKSKKKDKDDASKSKKSDLDEGASKKNKKGSKRKRTDEPEQEVEAEPEHDQEDDDAKENAEEGEDEPAVRIPRKKRQKMDLTEKMKTEDPRRKKSDKAQAPVKRGEDPRKAAKRGDDQDPRKATKRGEDPRKTAVKRGEDPRKAATKAPPPKREDPRKTRAMQRELQQQKQQQQENEEEPSELANGESNGTMNGGEVYLDAAFWKASRESLDGSFKSAREMLTSQGPWVLPDKVPDNKFADVAKLTLTKMDKHDKYNVFSKAVTDDDAPNYSDIVKNPMDFGTMRGKVDAGEYGTGSSAAAALYKDFLLVFDNCRLYNEDDSEVTEEGARILELLPETFVGACLQVAKRSK